MCINVCTGGVVLLSTSLPLGNFFLIAKLSTHVYVVGYITVSMHYIVVCKSSDMLNKNTLGVK